MELNCPYCGRGFDVNSEDVFVSLDRVGVCFVNCKYCAEKLKIAIKGAKKNCIIQPGSFCFSFKSATVLKQEFLCFM